MSTPFSLFPSVQELLLILRCRVACFADSLFRRLSSPIFQVSLIFVLGTLDSSCQHVSGGRNVGGCFLDTLELGGGFTSLVLRHGTDSPFLCHFVVVCL